MTRTMSVTISKLQNLAKACPPAPTERWTSYSRRSAVDDTWRRCMSTVDRRPSSIDEPSVQLCVTAILRDAVCRAAPSVLADTYQLSSLRPLEGCEVQ